jgi:radical SAM protein with 4Fe4S-binding SPASM domain
VTESKTVMKVPITDNLKKLLHPDLFKKEPIFTGPLRLPLEGEKVYDLTDDEIRAIRDLRGAVVDLHPGMGGVAPEKLIDMIDHGIELTSLDYMLTRGCNFECPWCFANSGPAQRDFLPFRNLELVTREARDLGTNLFILTGGEPLVYKDPDLGIQEGVGDHFFKIVEMIRGVYVEKDIVPKILTFDDVALITPQVAERFAVHGVGLCTKGDTLIPELQDYKVNQRGAFDRMQRGYQNLIDVGYGRDPKLRLVVNSVLDQTTFDGMIDLHIWVVENGFDHSIVPIHYCGSAEGEDQEAGIHSPHVKVLYDLISRIDKKMFGISWTPWSSFTYNKTCNRNRSGLHIRANGDVTACSESPGSDETARYTFGNILGEGFSLRKLVESEKLRSYREEFAQGHGTYVCSPEVCDLYANNLCQGGCATRSAYSKMDLNTGLLIKNENPHNYSEHREDPLCPAWTILAQQQGILRAGLLEEIHARLLEKSQRINANDFPLQ